MAKLGAWIHWEMLRGNGARLKPQKRRSILWRGMDGRAFLLPRSCDFYHLRLNESLLPRGKPSMIFTSLYARAARDYTRVGVINFTEWKMNKCSSFCTRCQSVNRSPPSYRICFISHRNASITTAAISEGKIPARFMHTHRTMQYFCMRYV